MFPEQWLGIIFKGFVAQISNTICFDICALLPHISSLYTQGEVFLSYLMQCVFFGKCIILQKSIIPFDIYYIITFLLFGAKHCF